jgi:hypothetical protein
MMHPAALLLLSVVARGTPATPPAAATPGAPATAPSLALFALVPAEGISEGVAKLLTESFTQLMRDSGSFSRVVSSSEIETLLGFERTRQMADCNAESCTTELANSLGVDMIANGTLGRIGGSVLLNLKLQDARKAITVAAVAERISSSTEEALLDRMGPAVRDLLDRARLQHHVRVAAEPLRAQTGERPAAPSASPGKPSTWSIPLLALGAAGATVGFLTVPAGLVGAVLAYAGVGAVSYLVANRVAGLPRKSANDVGNAGGAAAALVPLLLGMVILTASMGGALVALLLSFPGVRPA